MLQLIPTILLVGVVCIFSLLLIRIRFPLYEKLLAVFAPYVWVVVSLLKWFWREPKRYKEARGAPHN
jgi:hypothetical protein